MATSACYHCGEPVPKTCHYRATLDGQDCEFCCPACLAIAQTIHGSGLDKYYVQRDSNAFTPGQQAVKADYILWDDPKLNAEFVNVSNEITKAQLYIEGMHCTSCAWLIEKYLQQFENANARVNYQEQVLTISWPSDTYTVSAFMQAIADLGYTPHPYEADRVELIEKASQRSQIKRIGITAILMMQLGMLAGSVYAGDYWGISDSQRQLLHAFGLLFSLPLLYFSAQPFLTSAWHSLKNRRINMDVNISLAILGLYGGSITSIIQETGDVYFDSIAMLCLFILIARYIEFRSRYRLRQNTGLVPKVAKKQVNTRYEDTLIADLIVDDVVMVNQGETIPIDGTVVSGMSSADESMLTGESSAISKKAGDAVFAGSINHDGIIHIQVSQLASNCLIRQIEQACTSDSGAKPVVDDEDTLFAGAFTAIVLLLAMLTFIAWQWIDPARAFWVALSVLVISCPCALSLAAPTARSTVQFQLRRQGIIVRGAHVIDTLNKITQCFFDKTGTLTRGSYQITAIENRSDLNNERLLNIAARLEQHSSHPIASAFTTQQHATSSNKKVTGLDDSPAQSFNVVPNQGVEGVIDGETYRLGSLHYCQQWHAGKVPPDQQLLWVGLCTQTQMLAWFCLQDNLRADAPEVVRFLREQGIDMGIISGDSSGEVASVAAVLGIDDWQKSMTSEQKQQYLQQHQHAGAVTMMVGDGINDAPSLAGSHLSVTLANASDWLKSQTDLILINNSLAGIEQSMTAARRYQRIYRQNFIWALTYNFAAIPIAMAGFITPLWAAVGMSFSSILVVLNSQRLLTRQKPAAKKAVKQPPAPAPLAFKESH
ncbi:putative copper-importing P-type ATPase A [BD1-7 clade bacterium]|uniref:Putative copper-importing P-type ATPase A n=1 Tax=BD1-7 clade bacterium TaxID=2029982 RepID=A0A5S9QU50_9GAMM|nr:putative copper-importing P-type ATPase A [BD1-7 clade bacterium]CAA0121906.1 putative copper-importing P-type ATPase A [BD1-7 clade bacterium]